MRRSETDIRRWTSEWTKHPRPFIWTRSAARSWNHRRVLTEREREVPILVAAGRSNEEIAEHLVVSPATAKTHVNRAMTKLGARDRAQLIVAAYESSLNQPARP